MDNGKRPKPTATKVNPNANDNVNDLTSENSHDLLNDTFRTLDSTFESQPDREFDSPTGANLGPNKSTHKTGVPTESNTQPENVAFDTSDRNVYFTLGKDSSPDKNNSDQNGSNRSDLDSSGKKPTSKGKPKVTTAKQKSKPKLLSAAEKLAQKKKFKAAPTRFSSRILSKDPNRLLFNKANSVNLGKKDNSKKPSGNAENGGASKPSEPSNSESTSNSNPNASPPKRRKVERTIREEIFDSMSDSPSSDADEPGETEQENDSGTERALFKRNSYNKTIKFPGQFKGLTGSNRFENQSWLDSIITHIQRQNYSDDHFLASVADLFTVEGMAMRRWMANNKEIRTLKQFARKFAQRFNILDLMKGERLEAV